jgi:hypothetical protein
MIRCLLPLILLCIFAVTGNLYAKTYKGAELRTNSIFLYGKFEVRMKAAGGSGLLSSFFTYHDTPLVPAQWNEIDIEIMGRYNNRIQYNIITQGEVGHVVDKQVQFNPQQAFHVYAIEWTPYYIAWRVDGFEIYRETGDHVSQVYYAQKNMMNIWPPDNVAWAGTLDPAILPVYAIYDWVKYYEYTPGTGDNFTLLWSDNFDYWNQGIWSKGTHTWNGNLCDFIPENAVFQDGYLILCLTNAINTGYSGGSVVDQDMDSPYMVWARVFNDHVKVFFSEELDPVTSQNPANYIIPDVTLTAATLLADNRTVRLESSDLNPGQTYNLIASGISDLAQPPHTMTTKVIIARPALQLPVKINIGGDQWQDYIPDQIWKEELEYGHTGGNAIALPDTLQIYNTADQEIFRSELRDISFVNVRVPEGHYHVTLMFAETEYSSPASRIFDVYAEDQLIFNDVNIYGEAGFKKNTAVEKTITDLAVNDGVLDLFFQDVVGEPVLSGLKIEEVPSGLMGHTVIPASFSWSIFPNPFNSTLTIEYQLQTPDQVTLQLFDIQGRLVRTLFSQPKASGNYRFHYDAGELSTGIYFLNLRTAGGIQKAKKAIYIK